MVLSHHQPFKIAPRPWLALTRAFKRRKILRLWPAKQSRTSASQLDPLSPIVSFWVGAVHLWTRQYDQAIAICGKVASDKTAFAPAHLRFSQRLLGETDVPAGNRAMEGRWPAFRPPKPLRIRLCCGTRFSFSGLEGCSYEGHWNPGSSTQNWVLFCILDCFLRMPIWERKIRLSSGSTPLITSAIG